MHDIAIQDRFWAKVKKSNGCWLWQGAKNDKGYGIFSIGDTTHRAIRVAYEIAKGSIPSGKQIGHSCGNTQCVKSKHLSPVTNDENQAEKAERAAKEAFCFEELCLLYEIA